MNKIDWIAEELELDKKGLKACITLLDEGASLAFIARYRKGLTGGLKEEEIEKIQQKLAYFQKLEARKESIQKSLEEQGLWDQEKTEVLSKFSSLSDLEDFYLPFKPKRETKADRALKSGLGRVAALIKKQKDVLFETEAKRIHLKEYFDYASVCEACLDIAAQWINENQYLRKRLRQLFAQEAILQARLKDPKHEKADHYRDYHQFESNLARTPSHRLLAILRAEEEGVLRIKIAPDSQKAMEQMAWVLAKNKDVHSIWLQKAMRLAYQKSLLPSLAGEFKKEAYEKAQTTAIRVFANNLRQLLAAPPLHKKRVLAIDPGFKSGCKLVCLDEYGRFLHNENIYPHPPQKEKAKAQAKLAQLIEAYKIDAIAIGNGTAGRETEYLVERTQFKRKVQIFSVSEAGASVYSASSLARKEFPQYDVTVRGAISIGRRLQDPLAELVKIDPKAIGVGQYQHDLNAKKLDQELEKTVVSVVNQVGVELNQSSPHLLRYISGLGPKLAEAIIEYREEKGAFKSREELLKVKGLGAKAFEQSAGFLRIAESTNVLDRTAVHPESYPVVQKMAKHVKKELSELIADKTFLAEMKFPVDVASEYAEADLEAIREELLKAGRDQRGTMRAFSFDPSIRKIEDLKTGMVLPGLVSNLTKFGAFVDLGLKQAGLVHISEIANRFISDPAEALNLQQAVRVKVLAVDLERSRIQLSIKQVEDGKAS